jgi:hypothetical protein
MIDSTDTHSSSTLDRHTLPGTPNIIALYTYSGRGNSHALIKQNIRTSLFCDVTQRWFLFTDVSGQPISPIFKGHAIQALLDCVATQKIDLIHNAAKAWKSRKIKTPFLYITASYFC